MITGVLFMYIMYIELFHGAQMNDITLTLKLRNSLADLSKNSPQAITLWKQGASEHTNHWDARMNVFLSSYNIYIIYTGRVVVEYSRKPISDFVVDEQKKP